MLIPGNASTIRVGFLRPNHHTNVPSLTEEEPGLKLTGTRIAEYFRFGCERQLRLELSTSAGHGIPRVVRPGLARLSAAGRAWERRKVEYLYARFGPERVIVERDAAGELSRLSGDRVVELLREPGSAEVLVQPELVLRDPTRFAERYGLDLSLLRIAPAVPDLIRIRRGGDGGLRFQIVDVKGSSAARIPHYAQVAYYSLLLDEICEVESIPGRPDRRWGRIWARDGRGPARFPLSAYRHHVAEVLRRDLPRVVGHTHVESDWHVSSRCAGCVFLGHCGAEADAADDLSRIPGMTPIARRSLVTRGLRTVRALALKGRPESFRGSHALESQGGRFAKRAMALTYGKVFDVEARTHLMPPIEDVRVIVSAEGDPVSGTCFALGLRVEAIRSMPGLPPAGVWISSRGTLAGERAIVQPLLETVEQIVTAVDAARGSGRGGLSLHFFVYDRYELELLRDLLLRHLSDARSRPAIARLLRVLSPRAVVARPDILRSSPGTVVTEVVSALFALPVPYAYDLVAVSDRLRPSTGAVAWCPPRDFVWPFSSQVAFERIHDLWARRAELEAVSTPVLAAGSWKLEARELEQVIEQKLSAIDSVIAAIRERAMRQQRLQMRKEPFTLVPAEEALADPTLETLKLFTELESAAEAAGIQALHALSAAERVRRFESIRGLSLVERREDGTLLFEFDPDCQDTKFRPGDFNLVLTADDDRSLLEVDRQPWKRRALMMELVNYDIGGARPRVLLAPTGAFDRAEAGGWIDLDKLCVLDRAPADFSTGRILATLRALDQGLGESGAIRGLLHAQTPAGWPSSLASADAVSTQLLDQAARAYGRPVLNADQETAWRSILGRPLTLVWGPPGTGKTYLLAWSLIGLAAAARRAGRPFRVLVTASTHRAVVNLLARLAHEMAASGVTVPLRAVKLRGSGSDADSELVDTSVELLEDKELARVLKECDGEGMPLVVGSTVWSLWKQMRAAGNALSEDDSQAPPVATWFDAIVVDEASQMKVPEALIALSAMRAGARVVLCGDDRQLAPVLRGTYDRDAGTLFGSAFAHFAATTPPAMLHESRRMNAALVAYPRRLFYPGLVSMSPGRRIHVAELDLDPDDALLRETFFDPRDAAILCTYSGVHATARNIFEARLVARLTRLARRLLVDPATAAAYTDADFVSDAIAIISPHRAQNSAILGELGALGFTAADTPVVDTVERMQGNEREMIIVSYAVADREYAEAEAEFLLGANRFNVATTRARSKLIVLASEALLEAIPGDEAAMDGSMALKGYVAHCHHKEREITLPGPDGQPVTLRCRYRVLSD